MKHSVYWCLMRLSGLSASWRSYGTKSTKVKGRLWFKGWETLNCIIVNAVQKNERFCKTCQMGEVSAWVIIENKF